MEQKPNTNEPGPPNTADESEEPKVVADSPSQSMVDSTTPVSEATESEEQELGETVAVPQPGTEVKPEAAAAPPAVPATVDGKKKRLHLSRKQIIIVVCLVLLLAIAGVVSYLLLGRQADKSASVKSNQTAQTPALQKSVKVVEVKTTFLDTPKKLADLKIFSDISKLGEVCNAGVANSCRPAQAADVVYYQIGTTADGRQVIVFMTPDGSGGSYAQLMLGSGGKYQIVGQMNSITNDAIKEMGVDAYVKQQMSYSNYTSNVTYDVTTKLSDLSFPGKVTVKGQEYTTDDPTGKFMEHGLSDIRFALPGSVTAAPTVIGTVGSQTFYSLIAKDNANSQVVETYGTFKGIWSVLYRSQTELSTTDNKPISVEWTNGKSSSGGYFSAAPGCGTYGYVIAKDISPSQLVAVGKSPDGQQLYQLPATHALSQELYKSDYLGGPQENISDASLRNLSLQQFMDKHAYVLYKNTLGQYVVLQRGDMFLRGGCGKPVVYLYPQQKTDVSVRVGADVVVSEPHYPANGWQHVTAEPSGQLTYQGKQYDSLFWEGYGHGSYPDVASGTVVPSGQAVATIRGQLKAQGLNAKETKDFLDYWQPKLPKTPYVRLTWFNTAQMNQLAPLTVLPRPQTVIRVFLDFEGLQQPITLPAQQFSTPNRTGFTVVEWGGLLRDGIPR